jgi:putative drug exporter of the RND superfamily
VPVAGGRGLGIAPRLVARYGGTLRSVTSGIADTLTRFVVRRRRVVFAAWAVVATVLLPLVPRLEDRLDVSARILGSESASVEEDLARRFESPFARPVVLVMSGVPGPDRPDGNAALREVVAGLASVPGVTRAFSYLDRADPSLVGAHGEGALVIVGLDAAEPRPDRLVPVLRAALQPLALRLQARFPTAALRITGEAAINHDLWQLSTESGRSAERHALPLTLALLLLAFGSLVAASLPLAAGLLAIGLSLGVASLLARVADLSVLLVNVISMLGLALGIDYALLTVSRFREASLAGASCDEAAEAAARHAGSTVALSGAAVAIGFLGLLVVPLQELRSAAAGGLVVVTLSVLLATTLLPATLAALGARLDRGRIPFLRPLRTDHDGWRRWGRWVSAHPWLVLLVAGGPVVALALQAARLNPRVPEGDWLPAEMESAQAGADLRAMGRGGMVQSVRVLLELPEETQSLSPAGWAAAERLAVAVGRDPRAARVEWIAGLVRDTPDPRSAVAFLPSWAKRSFLGGEGDLLLFEVVPREGVAGPEATHFVRDLRRWDAAAVTGLAGARLRVGGLPAFSADYEDAVAGRFPWIAGLIVLGTLLALAMGFRSLLVPLKAIALNLLSVAGSFGALVLVFQDGHGVRWLGLPGPVDGVFPIVPVLVFCTVFGLSLDYEVFLVSRVAEGRRQGLSEDAALAEGLARTAGVITSAALIMVAVFAAFTLGGFVLMKMLGFALAVAVLLDATVIRMAIGPALLRLAGRWNWWPGERGTDARP